MSFWLSIARVWLRFSWRTIVGTIVSPVMGMVVAGALFAFSNFQPKTIAGLSDMTVFHIKTYLLGVGVLVWAVTAFSLIKFGLRNALTGVGFVAAVLWSASLSFLWQWTPAIVLAILWTSLIAFCVVEKRRRAALGAISGAVLLAWMTAFALSVLPRDPYSVFGKWQFLAALCLVPVVESSVTLFLYRKLGAVRTTGS